jgi:[ribosomal protein S5]-alanine N-acetyltransferase
MDSVLCSLSLLVRHASVNILNTMHLNLPGGCAVTHFQHSDQAALIANLADGLVQPWTLLIAHPYNETHANEWLARAVPAADRSAMRSWAIRDVDGEQIGGIGFHDSPAGHEHSAELGYWLASRHWGRGIMTEAVLAVSNYGFQELGISRITAAIFLGNAASARVLEKCGFSLEAPRMRRLYRKAGCFIDAALYAKIAGVNQPPPA